MTCPVATPGRAGTGDSQLGTPTLRGVSLKTSVARRLPLPTVVNGTDRMIVPRMFRSYESDIWKPLLDHVRPGDVFVDVGANVGLYAIAAAKRGATVVAVEPDRRNARTLRRYARLNQAHVDVIQAAASDETRPLVVAVRGNEVTSTAELYHDTATTYQVIPAVTLDSLLTGRGCDLLKIDVEGEELAVLKGAAATLRTVRVVMLEVHPGALERQGHGEDDLLGLIPDSFDRTVTVDGIHARWLLVRH